MAFGLSVLRADGSSCYMGAFGSDGDVHTYWHRPAQDLALDLLARIYDDGLQLERDSLDRLATELNKLEAHWTEIDAGGTEHRVALHILADGSRSESSIRLRDLLHERLHLTRSAIHMAKEVGGSVVIS